MEDEYKKNEKILCKTKGRLRLPQKKPGKVEYLVTEDHIIIEAEEPIGIPVLHITRIPHINFSQDKPVFLGCVQ